MILLVTNRSDLTADWLVLELEKRATPFIRFNTEDYPVDVGLEWTEAGESVLRLADAAVTVEELSAIWWRRPVSPRVESSDPALSAWLSEEAGAALQGVWASASPLWVNDPARNRAAGNKPRQLRAARAQGFDVPPTLVSNDPERLRAFAEQRGDRLVCKPLTHGQVDDTRDRVFWTRSLDREDIKALLMAGPEPYLLQELVAKAYDIRVTVVGDQVFAARIENCADNALIDWRRADTGTLRHAPETLPDDVADACLRLTRHFGLQFAAIDLARTRDGGHAFFELNPNGQWAWIEQLTGLPIAASLTDLLAAAS